MYILFFCNRKQNDVKMVDLKFVDFLGTWQHFAVPVSELNEEMLDEEYIVRSWIDWAIDCWILFTYPIGLLIILFIFFSKQYHANSNNYNCST